MSLLRRSSSGGFPPDERKPRALRRHLSALVPRWSHPRPFLLCIGHSKLEPGRRNFPPPGFRWVSSPNLLSLFEPRQRFGFLIRLSCPPQMPFHPFFGEGCYFFTLPRAQPTTKRDRFPAASPNSLPYKVVLLDVHVSLSPLSRCQCYRLPAAREDSLLLPSTGHAREIFLPNPAYSANRRSSPPSPVSCLHAHKI